MGQLTILYDGACPLCRREVTFLQRRDRRLHPHQAALAFVDIDRPEYDPEAHQGITYREAMGRIHGVEANGEVLQNLAVFRRAYELVGLGWLYAPTGWPAVSAIVNASYGLWAATRLRLTGRPSLDQLCAGRASCACDLMRGSTMKPIPPPDMPPSIQNPQN